MFSKINKTASTRDKDETTPRRKSVAPSIIGADCNIKGDLLSDGEIQVDGGVEGDIRTRSLMVGQSARIKGEIIAESVRVHGNVNGQIKAKHVSLAKSSHVIGDILHEGLSIDTGAFLEGHCRRMDFSNDTARKGSGLVTSDAARPKDSPVVKPEPTSPTKPDPVKSGGHPVKVSPATGTA